MRNRGHPSESSSQCEVVLEICVMPSAGAILNLNLLCVKNEDSHRRSHSMGAYLRVRGSINVQVHLLLQQNSLHIPG